MQILIGLLLLLQKMFSSFEDDVSFESWALSLHSISRYEGDSNPSNDVPEFNWAELGSYVYMLLSSSGWINIGEGPSKNSLIID